MYLVISFLLNSSVSTIVQRVRENPLARRFDNKNDSTEKRNSTETFISVATRGTDNYLKDLMAGLVCGIIASVEADARGQCSSIILKLRRSFLVHEYFRLV